MAHPHHLVSSSSSTFCFSDVSSTNPTTQTHLVSGFDPNPEIYSLTTGIEMIGFHSRHPTSNLDPPNDLWKGGFSSKPGSDPVLYGHGNHHHHHDDDDYDDENQRLQQEVVAPYVDESSLRSCVFPCEGNERPSQGLSLSLSSSNPSTIGLQSFQLRHHNHNLNLNHHQRRVISSLNPRDGLLMMEKSPTFSTQDEIFLGKSVGIASTSTMSMQFEMMRNSKYLAPAQELLNEFCSLGNTKQTCNNDDPLEKKKKKKMKNKEACDLLDVDVNDDDNDDYHNNINANSTCSSSSHQSLYGLNLLELQKRKTKLLGMLEELDRRYRQYYEQMKGVVSSFEAIAGPGSANVYSSLASKVMSRHFRCLRDGIVAQVKATKKAIGDKDVACSVHGSTKGETPRLRMLDQAYRQQRALQQMTMVENHPWRPQRGLPERSVSVLRAWLFEHFLHPYPSDVDKHILARQTGLSRSQVSNWFINARVRLWKPMVEQMYQEETKDEEDNNNPQESNFSHIVDHHQPNEHGQTTTQPSSLDQKPSPNQLLIRVDPDSLSSIINTPTTTAATTTTTGAASNKTPQHHSLHESQYGRNIEAFGSIENLDFPSTSSYNHHHHHHQGTTYGAHNEDNGAQQGFGGGGHVSLTLGLQQHGGNGVSLAFSSPATQGSLLYGRDHIDDCQQVVHHQYSLMDGDQTAQNLPYRNLMGAQLLHDFA